MSSRAAEELANHVLQSRGYLVYRTLDDLKPGDIISGAQAGNDGYLNHKMVVLSKTDRADFEAQCALVDRWAGPDYGEIYHYRVTIE